MNAQQHAKLTRARVVAALFSNPADTAHVIGLPEALAVFLDRLGLVETLALRQAQSTDAVYLRRDGAFEAMAEATLGVAGLVYAHADRAHLAELGGSVANNPSEVRGGRFEERVWDDEKWRGPVHGRSGFTRRPQSRRTWVGQLTLAA